MTTAVLAHPVSGGYAQPQTRRVKAVVEMTEEELELKRAELERRVRAGKWLKTGLVATLLELSRTKVHTMLASGEIGYRKIPGAAVKPQRECDPADVLRLLDERRRAYREAKNEPDGTPRSAI
jgi:hypothetical protein